MAQIVTPLIIIGYALPALLTLRGLFRQRLLREAASVLAMTLMTVSIGALLFSGLGATRVVTVIDALYSRLLPESLRTALGFHAP